MDPLPRGAPINCTAGAVPIKNEKGTSITIFLESSRRTCGVSSIQ